jgi:hypothetical protein
MNRHHFLVFSLVWIGPGSLALADPLGHHADLGGVRLLPDSDLWNRDIASAPVDARSAEIIAAIGADLPLHEDFGMAEWEGAPTGIPYTVAAPGQPLVPIEFEYADESDPGPYPIPPDAPIEGGPNSGGDRHVIVLDWQAGKLYEMFSAFPINGGASWKAGSGAVFDLRNPQRRPAGWTSADAAGLPILPGLVRYDEVCGARQLRHALRFTVRKSRRAYIAPASHFASKHTEENLPPMGMRVRLRADFDTSAMPETSRIILEGLKRYGMILADNGGDWFISGATDPRWIHEDLLGLRKVKGGDLEVIEMGEIVTR